MSNSENSTFQINKLGSFPYFLSDDERDALKRWGAQAIGLTEGSVLPTSDMETNFVEVAKGKAPPLTRFQRLWLRYLQAIDIQTKWGDSERKLIATTSLLDASNCQIEQLKSDVKRLEIWGKSAWQKAGPADMESATKIKELEANILDLLKKLPTPVIEVSKNSATEVTNCEQYRCLVKDGKLTALSDNQIFKLFNYVDDFGLTPRELEIFNNEHEKRKFRYQASDGVVVADWDWRDQNEAK